MLAAAVDAYVAIRRAAGFTFRSEARQLASFAAFSEARAESRVRASLAIEWAGLARSMSQRARRLGHVIRLARYLRAEDCDHEVPPAVFGAESDLVPRRTSSRQIRFVSWSWPRLAQGTGRCGAIRIAPSLRSSRPPGCARQRPSTFDWTTSRPMVS